jgi:hypothetical protein
LELDAGYGIRDTGFAMRDEKMEAGGRISDLPADIEQGMI